MLRASKTRKLSSTLCRSLSSVLSVWPASSLIDQEVRVTGSELEAGMRVRLETRLEDSEAGWEFKSLCDYQTDSVGQFSTASQPPLPGSHYSGLHSSGPLWSLQPGPGSRSRLWPEDIRRSLQYELSLSCPQSGEVLTTARAEKYFITRAVRRLEVREGPIRAVLFLPPNPGPAIITIYGGMNRGKVPEDRAALLASYGFVTLALNFYGEDGRYPRDRYDLNYLELALDFLLSQPEVTGSKVGLFGSSSGGMLVKSMMSCIGTKIGACVVQGPLYMSAMLPSQYNGEIIVEKTMVKFNGKGFDFKEGEEEALLRDERRQIKFENCPAPLLWLEGEDDLLLKSGTNEIAAFMIRRAERAGKRNVSLIRYPGTGHLLDLPHSPFCSHDRHPLVPPNMKINFGGQLQPHALAQIEAWRSTLTFFQNNL